MFGGRFLPLTTMSRLTQCVVFDFHRLLFDFRPHWRCPKPINIIVYHDIVICATGSGNCNIWLHQIPHFLYKKSNKTNMPFHAEKKANTLTVQLVSQTHQSRGSLSQSGFKSWHNLLQTKIRGHLSPGQVFSKEEKKEEKETES